MRISQKINQSKALIVSRRILLSIRPTGLPVSGG